MTYDEINEMSPTTITFKYLQTTLKKAKENITMELKAGSHTLNIKAKLQAPEYNTLKEPQYINLKKYKKVTIRNILPI
jgi:Mn-dependent DtxR family transcriptional regulator